ncbi:HD family phosphohydrolase [Desulforamulus hydrothermalis]|uniref:7TM receptor with intracellular metal dependent phosphohydrolase n=1 Tax=Desulforamulus hydrothermalis Lam5 = DSM 18033 TaxID=1121428 RepID=K8E0I3_9FIRM|nr:HDIG domain-containing metalloprotein [Desulforamulus hydrothermalis]CCO09099.1 7TM receptor with intracellular metal dependent phosphohydrolase [Desulforamulus hydrothermalis Lam5 = DSM 18033]SHH12593.1 metal dependent phosphohydrolase [Desulforamulus hydrothermalis Lam5 = DSM 18033]
MFSWRDIGGGLVKGLKYVFKNYLFRRYITAGLFFLLITILVSFEFVPQKVNLQVGQISPTTIYAPKSVVYIDQEKTQAERRQAMEKVPRVPEINPDVSTAVRRDINQVLQDVKAVQADHDTDPAAKVNRLKSLLPFELPQQVLAELAAGSPAGTDQLAAGIDAVLSEILDQGEGVTPEKLSPAKDQAAAKLAARQFAEPYRLLGQNLVRHFLRANAFFDEEKYRLLQQEAAESVPPVRVSIQYRERIISQGDVVTEEHIAKLQALGLSRPQHSFATLLGTGLLVALLMTVLLMHTYIHHRDIYHNGSYLSLIGIISLITLIVSRAVMAINISHWPELGALFGYLAPIAAAGMLITVLLDSRLALLLVTILSLLLGVMAGNQFHFSLVGFVGGVSGVYSVSKLSQRGDLVRAGIYVGLSNVVIIAVVGLITGVPWYLVVTSSLALGIANGLLSSILTNGALPYLETSFGITSTVRLLELSNPNNPLLKKLLTEAPGTYHHSILVGNLAEAAAESVGAEPLVVRVGAYYHDIGKLKRPYFFIENQLGGDNPHDKIAPSLSTLILTSHVKDGVELAREHKLPQPIIDIIEQHHGKSLCSFFYHKALEGDRTESVNEEDFRYEGPKPRTKEAAIVMLADNIEAAVRSLQNPTPGRVEGVVRKLIKDRLMDGQLDECNLTFKDLDAIANSFLRVLSGIFHNRIEYPDMKQEMERRKTPYAGSRK